MSPAGRVDNPEPDDLGRNFEGFQQALDILDFLAVDRNDQLLRPQRNKFFGLDFIDLCGGRVARDAGDDRASPLIIADHKTGPRPGLRGHAWISDRVDGLLVLHGLAFSHLGAFGIGVE
ncbi:MAG: hypothetical protein ACK56I_32285, partial [bacterium]